VPVRSSSSPSSAQPQALGQAVALPEQFADTLPDELSFRGEFMKETVEPVHGSPPGEFLDSPLC